MGVFFAVGRAAGARVKRGRTSWRQRMASIMLLAMLFVISPFQPPVGVVGFMGAGGGVAEAAAPWDGNEMSAALSGSGSDTDPYLIATPADLRRMRFNVLMNMNNGRNSHYLLTADIDLGNKQWTPIGSSGGPFAGTFDGGGYTISNMLVSGSQGYAGLFGYASGTEMTIKNVHLTDFTITTNLTGDALAGGLAGYIKDGTVTSCSSSGSASATSTNSDAHVGGLVGYNDRGTVTNSSASGSATAIARTNAYAGGLAGRLVHGGISNSTASGSATATAESSGEFAGGLVGQNFGGNISNSSASGSATLAPGGAAMQAVGGLVGRGTMSGTISNSSASGSASSTGLVAHVGGLVGNIDTGDISKSSAFGSATSSGSSACVGGLVGELRASTGSSTVSSSFSSGGASGITAHLGGIVGYNMGTNVTITGCRWLNDGGGLDLAVSNGHLEGKVVDSVSVDRAGLQALSRTSSWDIAAGWRLTSLDNDGGMHRTLFFTDDNTANVLSPDAVFTAPGALALSGGEVKTLQLIPAYFHAEPVTMSFSPQIEGVSISQDPASPDIVIVSADAAAFSLASAEVTITYQVSGDVNDTPQTKSFELRMFSTLEIKTSSLTNGRAGTAYSQAITVSGVKGTGDVAITVSEDNLPPGLSCDGTTTISGTPIHDGTFSFNVIAVDSVGQVAEKTVTLTILEADALFIHDAAFDGDDIWMGEPFAATVSADGGVKPHTFSATNADKPLPPGLDIVASGDISGTPTTAGEYTFNILVTDYAGKTHSRDFTLTVTDPNPPVDIDTLFPAPSASNAANTTVIKTGTPASVGTAITQVAPGSANISSLAASAANVSGHISLTNGLKIDIDLAGADGGVLFLNYDARLSMLTASLPELANWPDIDDEARSELLESLANSRDLAIVYEYVTPESASVPHSVIIGKGGLLGWSEAITGGVVATTATGISFKYAITDGPGKPRVESGSKFVVIPDGQTDNRLRDPLWLVIETSDPDDPDDPDDPHRGGGGVGCATGAGVLFMIPLLVLGAIRRKHTA